MDSTIVIDRITVTKKGRYALFCDGDFLFSVDEETYLRFKIKKGIELSSAEVAELRAASDYFSAKNKALDLLSYRDHSKRELLDKLKRKYDEHTAALAVEKMCELSLVDDRAFADKFAEELILRKKKSKRETENKLYEKGVPRAIIEAALSEYEESEHDAIKAVVESKYRAKLADAEKRNAVFAALMRRGFKAADIKEVLAEYGTEIDGEYYG